MQNKFIKNIIVSLKQKKIIAYPTESVFGLGCDPDSEIAINKLIKMKQRPLEKGFILISNKYKFFKNYIDDSSLTKYQKQIMFLTWPGNITWIIPKKKTTPKWITGKFDTIAIRIINHEPTASLCNEYKKPIVSTSANINGSKPCKTINEVINVFKKNVHILDGLVAGKINTSEIRDIKTGKIYRKG